MKIVMVYELNNEECEHGTGRGFSCDECASYRGKKLQRERDEYRDKCIMLKKQVFGGES